jgi:hypothetical protein
MFALSNSPAFSRGSYSHYARLVMFSFGFQKAFQRGFEDDDEVFFTKVRESHSVVQCEPKLSELGIYEEFGKCEGCRHSSCGCLGANGIHTIRTRWCVIHRASLLSLACNICFPM